MKSKKILLVSVIAAVGASTLLLLRGCDPKGRTTESKSDALKKRERTKGNFQKLTTH